MKNYIVVFLLIPFLFVACGKKNVISVVKVTGSVTFQGKPLAGAQVEFHPDETGNRPAMGVTDESGAFTIKTVGATKDGAMPGNYRVAIQKSINLNEGKKATPKPGATPGASNDLPPNLKSVLPEKWISPDSSGLTATVEPKKDNTFTFEIE